MIAYYLCPKVQGGGIIPQMEPSVVKTLRDHGIAFNAAPSLSEDKDWCFVGIACAPQGHGILNSDPNVYRLPIDFPFSGVIGALGTPTKSKMLKAMSDRGIPQPALQNSDEFSVVAIHLGRQHNPNWDPIVDRPVELGS